MESWFDFLRIEADLALTFIESSKAHSNAENSTHALGSARKALVTIQKCLKEPRRYGLSADEVGALEISYTRIELALAAISD